MKFKFILAIALILCVFSILPVSAENIPLIMTHSNIDNEHYNVTNSNTAYITLVYGYAPNPNLVIIPNEPKINDKSLSVLPNTAYFISNTQHYVGDYCQNPSTEEIPYLKFRAPSTNQTSTITYTKSSFTATGTVTKTFTITYDFIEYQDPFENVGINYQISDTSDNSVNYIVRCFSDSDNIKFSEIYDYNIDLNEVDISLNAINTSTNINVGNAGKYVYSWAMDTNTGNTKLLSIYLNGRDEIEDPSTPVYSDKIQAFIQTYDYQTGNILSGVNLSVYEVTENGDNLQIGNKIFSSINAESQTILMVKNNTEYFIENELTGYYAVKNTNIAGLNNRYGYLWNATLINPLRLYYSKLDPSAQYNANFIVQDVNNNGIAGVSVTMDNSITKISNAIGGLTFNNVSAGSHTFTFTKNGYQTAQRTIDIQLQYAAFTQTLFKNDQIIQPTVAPSIYPTIQPTVSPSTQPTLSPIDKPSNIMESVSFGFAKIFGVKTVENANYIFALMLILFPAVIAGGITHQALGFIAGGLVGFVFALAVGLVPVWVFFAMCLLAVIFMVLKGGNEGF